MNEEWLSYFEQTKENPPSQTAYDAMEYFGEKCGRVIDLGCGAGTDALYFLRKGWNVIAIDSDTSFIENLKTKMQKEMQEKLEIYNMAFEKLRIEEQADCMLANFSIPFCNPKEFECMWKIIVDGIKGNGVFAGVFFGLHDDWAKDGYEKMSFHTFREIEELMRVFEEVSIIEEEWDGKCCGENGEPENKHWHIFRVVGRKSTFE